MSQTLPSISHYMFTHLSAVYLFYYNVLCKNKDFLLFKTYHSPPTPEPKMPRPQKVLNKVQ